MNINEHPWAPVLMCKAGFLLFWGPGMSILHPVLILWGSRVELIDLHSICVQNQFCIKIAVNRSEPCSENISKLWQALDGLRFRLSIVSKISHCTDLCKVHGIYMHWHIFTQLQIPISGKIIVRPPIQWSTRRQAAGFGFSRYFEYFWVIRNIKEIFPDIFEYLHGSINVVKPCI